MLDTHFVAASVILSGLLFFNDPVPLLAASMPNDTNAHFGKNGSCSLHMDNGDLIPTTNQSFILCAGQSGATLWYGEIRNYNATAIVCSSGGLEQVDSNTHSKSFSCNITTPGYYKGYVYWKVTVNGQTMPHYLDYFFRR